MNKKANTPTLTAEEVRVRNTARRPRRPVWMPQDCTDTPTRYLCRCFDHQARDAVDNACFRTGIPPLALRDIPCGGFTVDALIAWMLDDLTFQSHNESFSGPVNTADLLCAFLDFFEYSAVPYMEKRHAGADGERVAAAMAEIIGGVVDGDKMILAVSPGEFSRRVVELLDIDADAVQAGATREAEKANGTKRKKGRGCTYAQAVKILEGLNVPRTRQTIANWRKGRNTPEGFTPETMGSVQSFVAWARIYANREQSKINFDKALHIDDPSNRRMGKFR